MKKHGFLFLCFLFIGLTTATTQEWERQHPLPLLVQLQDVDVDPSGLGLAGGLNGTILRTENFGATWEVVDAGFSFSVFEIAIVPGTAGQQAWAGLSGNTRVARTLDGGDNWEVINTGIPLAAAFYLSAVDEDTVYVGTQNGILKSADQGGSWTEVTPAPGLNWSSLFFVNTTTGWAGTDGGGVFKTTDGGASWTEQTTPFTERMQLHFLNADHGYAAVFRSFYETTDGGATWQLKAEEAFATHTTELAVGDAEFMVAISGNTTYSSADGGLTWERVLPIDYSYRNEGVSALADGRVWVAGSHTMVAHSSDFGMTYADQVPGNKNNLQVLDFTSMDDGWVAGFHGAVLRTTDGGESWEDLSLESDAPIRDGLALSADEFWVCQQNDILRTTDGGQSWAVLLENTGGTFTDLAQVEGVVFATNYNGKVYRSLDQGTTWEALPTGFDQQLFSVHFPDSQTGYAAGRDSTLLKTTDGGNTWERLDIPTSFNLNYVFFADADRGWVAPAANTAELFYTEDGGVSWSIVSLPVAGFWTEFRFTDDATGYLAGGTAFAGQLLRTTDGGLTWEVVHTTYGVLAGLDRQESETNTRLWITGFGGNIERLEEMTVGVRLPVSVSRLSVFPNPASDRLDLRLPAGLPPEAVLSVFDALGTRRMLRRAGPWVDLRPLEPGWYVLRLEDGQNVYQARVLVAR